MSEFVDDVVGGYVDAQPGMRAALSDDPVQQAQIESLRQALAMVERALVDEGVSEDVRRRVINRVVWGEPDGRVDVHAEMLGLRKQMLAADLPPEVARAWWELPSAGPPRPDGEPTA
ncbi:MAG: hypothetical protein HOV70_23610 [Streptomyces sp.]|nr:hypothetical protein [Streptomyces sp.]